MNKNENYLEQILKQILFTAVLAIAILYAPIGHFEKKRFQKHMIRRNMKQFILFQTVMYIMMKKRPFLTANILSWGMVKK